METKDLSKPNTALVQFNDIEQFAMFLNKEPDKAEIEINQRANNSRFIDIGNIERKLDEIYSGLWQSLNFHWQVVANEVVGSIDLHVFHPTARTWIVRTGAAAVQIQLRSKDRGGSGDITEIRDKIINTLQKDFPHLKAECIKNAAKSLGACFGRNLNRGEMMDYEPLTDQVQSLDENYPIAMELLKTCKLPDASKKDIEKQIKTAGSGKMKKIVDYLNTQQK